VAGDFGRDDGPSGVVVRFLAVGEAFVDVICDRMPQPGKRMHSAAVLRAGGSSINAALTAAELGADASVISRIGDDAAGDVLAATLGAAGVDARLARDPQLPTGVAVAFEDAVVADRGANAALVPADIPTRLPGDALLVSGFALFQKGSRDAAHVALGRFGGKWRAVDLASPRLEAHDFEANVVFATAAEAKAVTGLDPEAAARELARTFDVVCVKLGPEDGALAVSGTHRERAAARPVPTASPFGAGDAFAAAFLVGLAGGASLGDALERACASGARAASALQPTASAAKRC
jgi:sugar/nucleoside kinase (ribokinase family)